MTKKQPLRLSLVAVAVVLVLLLGAVAALSVSKDVANADPGDYSITVQGNPYNPGETVAFDYDGSGVDLDLDVIPSTEFVVVYCDADGNEIGTTAPETPGDYKARLNVKGDSGDLIGEVSFTINPAELTVDWQGTYFVDYNPNGGAIDPADLEWNLVLGGIVGTEEVSATAGFVQYNDQTDEYDSISVSKASDATTYTLLATLTGEDKDHYVIRESDKTKDFEINKMTLGYTLQHDGNTVSTSQNVDYSKSAYELTVLLSDVPLVDQDKVTASVTSWTDESDESVNANAVINVGTYTDPVITFGGDKGQNYKLAGGNVADFSVTIAPIGFTAEIRSSEYMFGEGANMQDKFSFEADLYEGDEITAVEWRWTNNDGLVNQDAATFNQYADGSPTFPTIVPGEYKFAAHLNAAGAAGKNKNYNDLYVFGTFTISKAKIYPVLGATSLTYTGEELAPEVAFYLYSADPAVGKPAFTWACIGGSQNDPIEVATSEVVGTGINAGEYAMRVALSTSDYVINGNHEAFSDYFTFVDGNETEQTQLDVPFTVTKKELTVSVSMSDYAYGEEGIAPSVDNGRVVLGNWAAPGGVGEGLERIEGYELFLRYATSATADEEDWTADIPTTHGTYYVRAQIVCPEECNYVGNTAVSEPFRVSQIPVHLVWGDLERVYNGAAFTPTCSVDENDIVGNDVVTVTVSGSGIDYNAEGYDATAVSLSNDNYVLPMGEGACNAKFYVTKKTIKIFPTAGRSKVYGDSDPTFTYTYSGTATRDGEEDPEELVFTGALSREDEDDVNEYAIEMGTLALTDADVNKNYAIELDDTPVTFAVTPAPLTITAHDKTVYYGDVCPDFSYVGVGYVGFKLTDSRSDLNGEIAYECVYNQYDDAGAYDIMPSGVWSSNYNITFKKGTLTVSPLDVSVTFSHLRDKEYTGQNVDPDFELSGVLPVDANDVTLRFTNGNTIEGTYNKTFVLDGERSGNYTLVAAAPFQYLVSDGTGTVAFTIQPRTITYNVSLSGDNDGDLSVVYDSQDHYLYVVMTNKQNNDNVEIEIRTNGTQQNANEEGYVANLGLTGDADKISHYRFANGEDQVTWYIRKAPSFLTGPGRKPIFRYNGQPQELVYGGEATGGTLLYSLDNENWSESVPTAINANLTGYTVYYKVEGNDNYNGMDVDSIKNIVVEKAWASYTTAPEAYTSSELTYNGNPQSLLKTEAVAKYGVPVQYAVAFNGVNKSEFGSAETVTGTNAGGYVVYCKIVETDNVLGTPGESAINAYIGRLAVTVTAVGHDDLVYGEPIPALAVTYSPAWAEGIDEEETLFTKSCDYGSGTVGTYTYALYNQYNENYDLTTVDGFYKINPREITVTIHDAESYYRNPIVEGTSELTSGSLKDGDEDIWTLSCKESAEIGAAYLTSTTGVGTYVVVGSCSDPNYNVTFRNESGTAETAAYEIKKRPVTVTSVMTTPARVRYGEAITLVPNQTAIVTDDLTGEAVDSFVDILEVTFASDSVRNAGTYSFAVRVKDDNYAVTNAIDGETAYLVIDPLPIRVKNTNKEKVYILPWETVENDANMDYEELEFARITTENYLTLSDGYSLGYEDKLSSVAELYWAGFDLPWQFTGDCAFRVNLLDYDNYYFDVDPEEEDDNGCDFDENAFVTFGTFTLFVEANKEQSQVYGENDAFDPSAFRVYYYTFVWNDKTETFDLAKTYAPQQEMEMFGGIATGGLTREPGVNQGRYAITLGSLSFREPQFPAQPVRESYDTDEAFEEAMGAWYEEAMAYAEENELLVGAYFNYEFAIAENDAAYYAIEKKAITVSGITASDKTYDGNDFASLRILQPVFTGIVGDDTLVIASVKGRFPSANAGENLTVTISDLTLGGENADNYVLAEEGNQTTTTASIRKYAIDFRLYVDGEEVERATDAILTYDGGTHTFVVKALGVNGEVITLTEETEKNVFRVSDVEIYAQDFTADGSEHENYTLENEIAIFDYAIEKREITVSGITASDKVYDGSVQATLIFTTATLTGKAAGDDLDVRASGAFADTKAGENKTVSVTGLTLIGEDADNYFLAEEGQQSSATATIAAKEITVTADNKTSVYGEEIKALTATLGENAIVEGDKAEDIFTLSCSEVSETAKPGTYIIKVNVIDNANYTVNAISGAYTITEAAPTTTEDGTTVYEKEITKEEAEKGDVDLTTLFNNAKASGSETKEVTVTIGETKIVFNGAAIEDLAGKDVKIKVTVVSAADMTENAPKGAQMIFDVSLDGATFENGTAVVSAPFDGKVPTGKEARVYYVDENGKRTAMKTTYADGVISFETNHFSQYIVTYELKAGTIAGIVVACVVFAAGVAVLLLFLLKKKGKASVIKA